MNVTREVEAREKAKPTRQLQAYESGDSASSHKSSVNLQDMEEDEKELNPEALKYIGFRTPAKKRKRRFSGKENVEPGSSMGSDIANSSFGSVVSDSLELNATLRTLGNAIKELNGEIRNMRQTDKTLAKENKYLRESVLPP